jgi:hypothetical protein
MNRRYWMTTMRPIGKKTAAHKKAHFLADGTAATSLALRPSLRGHLTKSITLSGAPVSFSIARSASRSGASQNETAVPLAPARAVRPM